MDKKHHYNQIFIYESRLRTSEHRKTLKSFSWTFFFLGWPSVCMLEAFLRAVHVD